jgi:hypothetical protein
MNNMDWIDQTQFSSVIWNTSVVAICHGSVLSFCLFSLLLAQNWVWVPWWASRKSCKYPLHVQDRLR